LLNNIGKGSTASGTVGAIARHSKLLQSLGEKGLATDGLKATLASRIKEIADEATEKAKSIDARLWALPEKEEVETLRAELVKLRGLLSASEPLDAMIKAAEKRLDKWDEFKQRVIEANSLLNADLPVNKLELAKVSVEMI